MPSPTPSPVNPAQLYPVALQDTRATASMSIDPLELMGHRLHTSIRQHVALRAPIEQRWLADYQQYLGQYDEKTQAQFERAPDRASVFLNLTRQYANQAESQLADMLFPSDSQNWGIEPTPRPELVNDLNDNNPATANGMEFVDPETGQPVTNAEVAAEATRLAREMAQRMEKTIHDQLVECDFNAEARLSLHYATVLGTGVLCGPEARVTTRYEWQPAANQDTTSRLVAVAAEHVSHNPTVRNVLPWDFFPDMTAATLAECEFVCERSYLTRKQVRRLRDQPHYLKTAIGKVLEHEPHDTHVVSDQTLRLRQLVTGSNHLAATDNRYEFWTYRGPVERDALLAAGLKLPDDDPRAEYDGTVVFCGYTVVKCVLNPLDTEEWPYTVFNWQRDDFSLFGYGIPYMGRNEQRLVNTAWRLMLDNSSKAAGPQVVIKRSALIPADNDSYTLTPWKTWYADETVTDVRTAFATFTFPSLQQEISNILQMAQNFMTQTMGLPPQPGQGNGQTPHTLGGMAMLMNSANTDRRRQVRDWDDNVTKPLIRRFYHWNMQYHPDTEIKGDFEVHARGTSALLLREQQALNLMALLDKYAGHPATASALKPVEGLRKIVQAMHIPAEQLVKTEDELQAEAQQAAQQPQQQDPQTVVEQMRMEQIKLRAEFAQQLEQMRAANDARDSEADRQLRRELAQLDLQKQDRMLQLQAMEYANRRDIDYKRILADLKKARWHLRQDSDKFNAEVAIKQKQGETSNYGLT